ncbi:MAG: hypothetical protein JWM96_599 [Alphaproteobacteria bacterium]|nr:hypothetical protein [Alphaproteobacteria bacterium]
MLTQVITYAWVNDAWFDTNADKKYVNVYWLVYKMILVLKYTN